MPGETRVKAAVLTPAGRGAVATTAVWGHDCAKIIEPLFLTVSGKPLRDSPTKCILFGRWKVPAGEELVVVRRDATNLEIHSHGGSAAPDAILHDLENAGCEIVSADDWLGSQECCPIRIAALTALQSAPTLRTARILLDQFGGALQQELDLLEADLLAKDVDCARRRIETLLNRAKIGEHLTKPYRVVIAGPPNVGKSSLINSLLGYERAIVFDQPGTTRDVVTALTSFDGWPVELADTAGLRDSSDPLEYAGVKLACEQIANADAVVLVFDVSEPWIVAYNRLVSDTPGAIVVHNKCDLTKADLSRPPGLFTSTVTGTGLAELIGEIARRLVPMPPPAGSAIPFTPEIVEELQSCIQSL